MRAAVYDAIGGPIEVRQVADPTPPPGGVVVRVEATGLCRSDWHAWVGHDDIVLPHVPGHELAGVVAGVGSGVRRWHEGDRVTVPFVEGCGRCEWCRSGDAQVCPDQQQPGFTHWGSFAEFVVIHAADHNLVRLPDGVSFAAAASLGCRFATAYRALTARAGLGEGERLVVIGAGGVGLSCVQIARALGAEVVAVDRDLDALAAAASLGAVPLHADGRSIPDAVADLTGGGAHVSVDAVGSESACGDAIRSLRRRGRHVQVGLLPASDGLTRLPMGRVISWELDVFGSHGMAASHYPALLGLVERGVLRPQDLVTRTIGLEEAAALLPVFDGRPQAGIVVIDPRR